MYAVIATGGKQYRVQEGAVLRIEKLDAEAGASVEFGQVLLVGAGSSVTLGAPFIGSAKVVATVQSHGKGDKVRIVKFRRRKHYKREGSHRQPYTEVKITQIVAEGSTRRTQKWHTKKLAAALVTAAIHTPSDWASRSTAART